MFTPDQAKGLSMVFLQGLGNEVPITRRVLAAVPAAQLDFKLGEKGRTTRELMWHIVRSEKWFGEGIAAGSFAGDPSDGPPPATAAAIQTPAPPQTQFQNTPPTWARPENASAEIAPPAARSVPDRSGRAAHAP